MPTSCMLMCTRVLRLASVCALRLPTTSSAEVPAAGTHNIKRASPDALGQHGRRNTDQKDQLYFASRSIRQWRGQASLTDVNRVSNSCLRRKSPTRKTFGVCASACDQRHLRRPERSPLHDVRQHARRCLVGQPTGEFVFLTDEQSKTGLPSHSSQQPARFRPSGSSAAAFFASRAKAGGARR